MNRDEAKHITLRLLDKWEQDTPPHGSKVRFVVIKNRMPAPGRQDAGRIFKTRLDAVTFGESRLHGDYALLALTEHGSVDITPQ